MSGRLHSRPAGSLAGGRVDVVGVSKSFGAHEVLHDVTFTAPAGSVTALLGPSGQGKTTLLRIAAGFERPDAGELRIDGEVMSGPGSFVPPERRGIGYVPQEAALFPHLDVARNIAFGLPRGSRARVDEMLELVGLVEFRHHRPAQLSGGQRQRVALARALAPEPRLVLLDEPFSALDAGLRAEVRDDAVAILRATGTTVLLVTHDQDEALEIADHVVVLLRGTIAQAGTPQSIYDAPAGLEVARFIGQANLLAAEADGAMVRSVLGEAPALGRRGDVTVLVRPEHVEVERVGSDAVSEPDRAQGALGTVERRSYYGHDGSLTVLLDSGQTVVARVSIRDLAVVGARVRVRATAVSAVF